MRVLLGIAAAACAAVAVSVALAQPPYPSTPPNPTPVGVPSNPWPGKKVDIAFYVETVTASPGESRYGKAAPQTCTQTNFFARGERIVWHVVAVKAHTGKVIQPEDVKYAYLMLPGFPNTSITFVPHGKDPTTAPWTWNARADIPLDYPLGVLPFQIVFKLKGWGANKVARFTQLPLAPEDLTIIDHR